MNRNFGIGILVLCFGSSAVNLARAVEAFQVSPIIVQPYEIQELNGQVLNRDRQNRDREIAIQEIEVQDLIEENNKLIQDTLARQKGQRLKKINQTIPADNMALPPIIVNASHNQRQAASDEQAEVMTLRNKMHQQGLDLKAKDESICWLNQVVAVVKNKAEYYQLTSRQDQLITEQAQEKARQEENQIAVMKTAIQSGRAQSDQMTLIMSDYQKKLESKNNAYNEQLREILSSKNDWVRMQGQITDLSARLQEKETQVVKIKKDMYDLQKLMSVKDRDAQAKNLSLSIELALARKKLNGTPGSDEINFLRAELKKDVLQLKQKDEMILQLKERPTTSAPHDNNNALSKDDRLQEKLKQALDEINEQGRVINALVRKLQDAGQSVNLTPYFTKS